MRDFMECPIFPGIIDYTFAKKDDANIALRLSQARECYDLSTKRSKANKIWVICHQGGSYRPYKEKQGKYKTNTIKSGCPFEVTIEK